MELLKWASSTIKGNDGPMLIDDSFGNLVKSALKNDSLTSHTRP